MDSNTFISRVTNSLSIEKDVIKSTTDNSIELQTINKKSKNHICQYCYRAFPSISLLATHTRVSKKYKTIQNEQLNKIDDYQIHTGERPFSCVDNTCKKSFKTQGALDLHVRRHR